MTDDDALRRLHDADRDPDAPDLSALRHRFVDFIQGSGGDDTGGSGDDDPGGTPDNSPGPRTSGPDAGIQPSETGDGAGRHDAERGPAMSDTNGTDDPGAQVEGDLTAGPAGDADDFPGFRDRAEAPESPDAAPNVVHTDDETFGGYYDYDDASPSSEFRRFGLGRAPVGPTDSPVEPEVDLPEGEYVQWSEADRRPYGTNDYGADGYPHPGGVDPNQGRPTGPNWNTPGHGIDQGYRPFPTIIPRIPATASGFGDVVEYEGTEYFWDGDTWNEVGSRPLIGELTRHGDVTIHNGEPWVFLDGTWFKDHTDTPQPSPQHYWDIATSTWVLHDAVGTPPHQPGTVADQNGPNRFVWSDGGANVPPPWVGSPDRPAPPVLDDSTPDADDADWDAFVEHLDNPRTKQGILDLVEEEIFDAGDPPELHPLLTYIEGVDEAELAAGVWEFYERHDFPPHLHDAVQWMQARRGINPRNFRREVEEATAEAQRRYDEEWERQRPRREVIVEVGMDIDAAGSDEALQDLLAYVRVVDETEFERGLDHFYAHHDFPESLHDPVQRMQAHRGTSPRKFEEPAPLRTDPRQRVEVARGTSDSPPLLLDEPTSGLDEPKRRSLLAPIVGVVIVAVIGIGFLLTRVGDSEPAVPEATIGDTALATGETSAIRDDGAVADPSSETSVAPTDPSAPATSSVVSAPAQVSVELPQPLFIVLSDESQYPVWGLTNADGSTTYVLRSPTRSEGCLLISYGGNDVDTFGECTLGQIGTSQPATVLYDGDDGSVLIELRNPEVVNLTDEIGFAQSAIVDVLDAPVVPRTDELTAFGSGFTAR